ncbi:dolichyl-phosphate beta-glucosyltransferase [Desulfatibacillum aliphaticivorans]|uniref:dolichyl-phosphate beta-glucosyltransferase n=1 Tax=Desulfatibacillum aliphaticivorans TaxID=218208 RepID=UPI0006844A2E|nr:dolichyl-phosphate beta-glucosyltransferase [Desulfatibacillum aliphaticivorans]
MINLSIVIPAYNEENRIVKTLSNTINFFSMREEFVEVIIVDDGSTDNTIAVSEKLFQDIHNMSLKILSYKPNRGKGYAVAYGMVRASGGRVLFMDADYSVAIEEIVKAEKLLNDTCDIAIASRAIPGSKISASQSFFRRLSSKLYRTIQNCYLGLNIPDTQCGFKMFTRAAAMDLFSNQKLYSVIFDPEILWMAKQKGYSICQFPVSWTFVGDSRIVYDSLGKSIFVFQELLKIKKLHKDLPQKRRNKA